MHQTACGPAIACCHQLLSHAIPNPCHMPTPTPVTYHPQPPSHAVPNPCHMPSPTPVTCRLQPPSHAVPNPRHMPSSAPFTCHPQPQSHAIPDPFSHAASCPILALRSLACNLLARHGPASDYLRWSQVLDPAASLQAQARAGLGRRGQDRSKAGQGLNRSKVSPDSGEASPDRNCSLAHPHKAYTMLLPN